MFRTTIFAILLSGSIAQSNITSSRNDSSPSTTTINGLIGVSSGLVGSIISANPCETVAVVTCTAGERACSGIYEIPITFTQGPYEFQFDYENRAPSATISVSENCHLQGQGTPTLGVCEITGFTSSAGRSARITTTTTYTGADVMGDQILITGGVDNLVAGQGSCTSTPSTTYVEPTQSGSRSGSMSSSGGTKISFDMSRLCWIGFGLALIL